MGRKQQKDWTLTVERHRLEWKSLNGFIAAAQSKELNWNLSHMCQCETGSTGRCHSEPLDIHRGGHSRIVTRSGGCQSPGHFKDHAWRNNWKGSTRRYRNCWASIGTPSSWHRKRRIRKNVGRFWKFVSRSRQFQRRRNQIYIGPEVTPVVQPSRPIALAHRQCLDAHLDELLANDIIEGPLTSDDPLDWLSISSSQTKSGEMGTRSDWKWIWGKQIGR